MSVSWGHLILGDFATLLSLSSFFFLLRLVTRREMLIPVCGHKLLLWPLGQVTPSLRPFSLAVAWLRRRGVLAQL